jgi:hypothetical protein
MSTAETVSVIVAVALILLALGNIVFSVLAERNNPPIGTFTECDGVRLHYLDCGDPAAPCVVLFHGNGSMIQDFTISGLVDRLARCNRVLCFDRPGFGYSQRPRSRIWTATAQAALFVKALNQLGRNINSAYAILSCWATHGVRWSLSPSDCEMTIRSVVLCLPPVTTFRLGVGTCG